jgi:hypothetical protein
MTQALEVHERISELGGARAASQSATAEVTASKAGRFVFVFGISFAILYTLFEQMNWPLFTYHPAVGKLDFWMQRARSGEGPGMYWYGWLALAFPCAALIGWLSSPWAGGRPFQDCSELWSSATSFRCKSRSGSSPAGC